MSSDRYVQLLGAEDVSSAGHRMRGAADTISGAAATMENALDRHRQFMDDWLSRLENILRNHRNGVID